MQVPLQLADVMVVMVVVVVVFVCICGEQGV